MMQKGDNNMKNVSSSEILDSLKGKSKMDDAALKMNSDLLASGSKPGDGFAGSGSDSDSGEEGNNRSAACISHGSMSVMGRRRTMEDTVTVALQELGLYDFYAVYDGHCGAEVAHACRDRLHKILAKEVGNAREREGEINWKNAMATSFAKMDEEINTRAKKMTDKSSSSLLNSMGSTAVAVAVTPHKLVVGNFGDSRAVLCTNGVAVQLTRDHKVSYFLCFQSVAVAVTPHKLVVGNCGDSRAVLCTNGVVVQVTRDHKSERPDERKRIESSGGSVIDWKGQSVLGVLSISRSIGDHFLRPYVISEREITVWERKEADEFLIIATDGFWDVVANDLARKVVKGCLSGKIRRRFAEGSIETSAMDAAAILTELAIARGSKDNISVIVVQLKKYRRRGTVDNSTTSSP